MIYTFVRSDVLGRTTDYTEGLNITRNKHIYIIVSHTAAMDTTAMKLCECRDHVSESKGRGGLKGFDDLKFTRNQ